MKLHDLARTRLAGDRPASMILLSLVGALPYHNPAIEMSLDESHDLRPLLDLDVQVWHCGQRVPELVELASKIIAVRPRHLSMLDVRSGRVVAVKREGGVSIKDLGCPEGKQQWNG